MNQERKEIHLPIPDIGVPVDRKGRIRWSVLSKEPEKLVEVIETQARALVEQGVNLTGPNLSTLGLHPLTNAVRVYYPGKWIGLKEKLSLKVRQPRSYWSEHTNIEAEARQIFAQHGRLTAKLLTTISRGDLLGATALYPGGLRSLNRVLAVEFNAYQGWTPERIEEEARKLLQDGNNLSFNNLRKAGAASLANAINKHYPGKFQGLRENLGLKVVRLSKPSNYWRDPEVIRQEARRILEIEGSLNDAAIRKNKASSLTAAITQYYPGQMRQLQIDLGLKPITKEKKKSTHWTEDLIRQESLAFYQDHKRLTVTALVQEGAKGLGAAITRKYPGGITQLRQDLGLETGQRPNNYWKDPANIEKEALEFTAQYGWITQMWMLKEGRSDLWAAIIRYYPGGIKALRETLKIPHQPSSKESPITSEEANLDLENLLEG
jgi:hypothetical protein